MYLNDGKGFYYPGTLNEYEIMECENSTCLTCDITNSNICT